jgi:hypothetical protein
MADEKTPAHVDFTTFALSLGSSALVHLGDMSHPDAGQLAENLLLARQTIDILAMLEDKTRGNLTAEEARFLRDLLADLRLRFVERSRATRGA